MWFAFPKINFFFSPVHPQCGIISCWLCASALALQFAFDWQVKPMCIQILFSCTIFRCKQKQYWGLVCFKIATVTNCLVYSGNGWEVIAFPSGEVIRPPPSKTNFRSFTSIFSFRQHVWNGTGLEDQEQRKTLPDI